MKQQSIFNPPDQRRTIPAIRNHLISSGFNPIMVDIFLGIHKANRHIFEAFEAKALQQIQGGATRLSSKAIFEKLREDQALMGRQGDWKLNNNFTSYFGRVFAFLRPDTAQLWEFREIKQKEAA